ncbi:MAG TPA: zf-HC2 domain-containing protein [Candidatus Sulfotelmatobacter sp.]|nr:zf-HC2 domain-containing protein [Candidatus Sulfotelmatobacter sp.]
MTELHGGRPTPEHAGHDPLLIVRAAADDTLSPAERAAVEARLASCPACATLEADLRAIAAGLATDLPTPRRPRDFRLSPDDLVVRGPTWRERLHGALAGPVARPLAGAVCALGLLLAVTGAVLPHVGATATLSNDRGTVTDAQAPGAGPGVAGGVGKSVGATPAASAASAGAGGGNGASLVEGGPSPSAVPIVVEPPPHASAPPSALGSVPSGGAGDYTAGSIPPVATPATAPGGLDPDGLLIGAGVVLFAAGGGTYIVLRRRPT